MLFCFVFGIIATDAWAGSTREPAACLLFPYFNTNPDNLAVFSITNVGSDPVSVRLVWIDEEDCSPEDQWIQLSGNDTFTFLDQAMNPEGEQGFMYAYVYEGSGSPANANCLVGQEIIIGTWDPQNPLIQYGINAVGFQAINVVADQKLHLDDTLVTTQQGGRQTLAISATNVQFTFGGVTNAKYLLVLAYDNVQLRLNSVGDTLIDLTPLPATEGSPISTAQKADAPARFFLGPITAANPVTALFLTNPSGLATASYYAAVVGEAV